MMEFRNAAYNAFGGIDCEINHPLFGWIPFTANLSDPEPLGAAVFTAAQEVAGPYVEPVIDPAAVLAEDRAGMVCTAMQGKLALGPDRWAIVEAYRDDPATTWAERTIIDSAGQWVRTSENIAFFAYLLSLSDAEVDNLFRLAQGIDA